MIFSDVRFFAIFAGCWISFLTLPRRWRPQLLAAWGALFYFLYAGRFLFVVIALGVLVFFSGHRAIGRLTGVAIVLLLAYIKATHRGGVLPDAAAGPVPILIPLGFSYLAFELLHVIIERRRGRIGAVAWPDLAAFVLFAPARVAGPIKRLPDFTAAVREAELTAANTYAGMLRVLIGFAKKFLIADLLAPGSDASSYDSTGQVWTIVLAYSFRIYFDFSAYSDIAIGFARILGIRLPENFERPYLAKNIREFWERWHITLSHWVRDYVFMPLGRKLFSTRLRRWPIAIAVVSYLAAFTIVGAWHGLTASFVLWGVYHGVLLSLYHVIRLKTPAALAGHPWYRSRLADGVRVVVTFFFVTVGWVPFMLPIAGAARVLALMFGF